MSTLKILLSSLIASAIFIFPLSIPSIPAIADFNHKINLPVFNRNSGEPLTGVVQIALGNSHTCALTQSGGVKCWGDNQYGQLGDGTILPRSTPSSVVGLPTGVIAIASGGFHTCALTNTEELKCWGANSYGQLGDSTTTQRSTPVSVVGLTNGVHSITAGGYHTCVLTSESRVQCWGYNEFGQLGDGTTLTRTTPVDVAGFTFGVTSINAGGYHTCAIVDGGQALCWGHNGSGQLGDGTNQRQVIPSAVFGLEYGTIAISTGRQHTCAITSQDGVKCWGDNEYGQLGDGTNYPRNIPVDVLGILNNVVSLASGDHTCALLSDGQIRCWGKNNHGQLGDGTTTNRRNPVSVIGLPNLTIAVSTGSYHTCALSIAQEVYCWGYTSNGRLGDGTITQRTIPIEVGGLYSGLSDITTGAYHSCVISYDGKARCWGMNYYGQLGDGTTTDRNFPVPVAGLNNNLSVISSNQDHTCALTETGDAMCWGNNSRGQLGDGTTTQRLTPVNVLGLPSGLSSITTGYNHSCALTSVGGIKCWGDNSSGQLGDGTNTQTTTPVDVFNLTDGVMAISAGRQHTCALLNDGGVKCWGNNGYGQLGNNTNMNSLIPVGVTGLGTGSVISLSTGRFYTCAVTILGGIKCWGNNSAGQLGNGSTSHSNLPVDVVGLSNGMNSVTAGNEHTCAISNEGGIKCWGANNFGQLGDGSTHQHSTPIDVEGFSSEARYVDMGFYHTCAMTNNRRVKCWGLDDFGQLGISTTNKQITPVSVLTSAMKLSINYSAGHPGSYFTVTGWNIPIESEITLSINGATLTDTIHVNESGSSIFFLNTLGCNPGFYLITASDGMVSAATVFVLKEDAPTLPLEGGGQTIVVPAGIAQQVYPIFLPGIFK